jgi:hypothetical protein
LGITTPHDRFDERAKSSPPQERRRMFFTDARGRDGGDDLIGSIESRKSASCGDLPLAGTRGKSVVMKNRRNNVLPFQKPPNEPKTSTIVAQIGRERFAIHFEIEDLPAQSPLIVLGKRGATQARPKLVK